MIGRRLLIVSLLVVVCFTERLTSATNLTKRDGGDSTKDQGCHSKFRGICMPISELQAGRSCPFLNNGIAFSGCSAGSICCYPQHKTTPAARVTTPPPAAHTGGTCGRSYVNGNGAYRVVGGWEADKGEWPWMVQIKSYGDHHCGGSLISDQWVVTAAHCFMYSEDATNFQVVLGEHDRTVKEGTEQFFSVSKIIKHSSFNDPYKGNDIAMVKLTRPVKYDRYVQKICLPTTRDEFYGTVCTVAGWGSMNPMWPEFPDKLQEVNVPMKQQRDCAAKVDPYYTGTNVCAGFNYGTQDACGGDSGGPLMCRLPGSRQWKLAGVVSWGEGCALPQNPGVYTKVNSYLGWIRQIQQTQ